MASLILYARLVPSIDGQLLKQESAVTISDEVNKPCRITITSAIPSYGYEFDAHAKLGEQVRVGIHSFVWGAGGGTATLLCELDGKIVSAVTEKPCDCAKSPAKTTFVVEAAGVRATE